MSSTLDNGTGLELAAEPVPGTRGAPLVLLTGGKGGVGKTTLAAELGVLLASQRKRVLLVDFDLGLANLDVLLELTPTRTVEDGLAGRCDWTECIATGPGGVEVLPAGSGNADMGRPDGARRAALLRAVRELAVDYDLVLGDSAAGIGPDVLAFAAAADHVFVVTTPEPAALTDAYGFLKALDGWAHERDREVPTPELVVNRVSGLEQAEVTAGRLQRVCERFLCRRPRSAGWIPQRGPGGLRRPAPELYPKSLYHSCLCRLGGRVSRLLEAPRVGATR